MKIIINIKNNQILIVGIEMTIPKGNSSDCLEHELSMSLLWTCNLNCLNCCSGQIMLIALSYTQFIH